MRLPRLGVCIVRGSLLLYMAIPRSGIQMRIPHLGRQNGHSGVCVTLVEGASGLIIQRDGQQLLDYYMIIYATNTPL